MPAVLTPITVRPPKPKKIACNNSATNRAGKAAQPSTSPARPLMIRWTLEGPIDMCTSEAQKKVALSTPAAGIFSISGVAQAKADAGDRDRGPHHDDWRRKRAVDYMHVRSPLI